MLERSGAATPTGLTLPPDMPYERFEALAFYIGTVHKATLWALGDLVNFGEDVYGHEAWQAIDYAVDASGLSRHTIQNYAWVCRKVPRSRRHPKLSPSHHGEVAKMEPDEQESWLRRAVDEQMTRTQLRTAIHGDDTFPPAGPCVCPVCGREHERP